MKFLNRFFNYIKLLIKKDNHLINEITEESINENNYLVNQITEESINENNDIKQNIEYSLELNDKLDKVDVGDIIWAKRYDNENEMLSIADGHREGPFLVIEKLHDKLLCSPGTSVKPDEEHIKKYFELDKNLYNLSKITYFSLSEYTEKNDYIQKMDTLNKNDKNKLFNSIRLYGSYFYQHNQINKKINIPLQCGDIIKNKLNYLIIDIHDNKLSCIPINMPTSYLKNNINFSDFKNLDYSKLTLIDYNAQNNYINTVTDNILIYVLKKQKEYIDNYNNQKNVQRGSVIIKNNRYYYVYGEKGQNWLIFEIKKNDTYYLDCDCIIVKGKKFYTNYINSSIDKKDSFKTIALATLEEIDNIKNKRQFYIKKSKITQERLKIQSFHVGDIITTSYFKNKQFVILNICKKTFECMSLKDFKDNINNIKNIKKKDAILLISKEELANNNTYNKELEKIKIM